MYSLLKTGSVLLKPVLSTVNEILFFSGSLTRRGRVVGRCSVLSVVLGGVKENGCWFIGCINGAKIA